MIALGWLVIGVLLGVCSLGALVVLLVDDPPSDKDGQIETLESLLASQQELHELTLSSINTLVRAAKLAETATVPASVPAEGDEA